MKDDIKSAEKRAYANGYQAASKRARREREAERRFAEARAFWDRAYLAVLPVAMSAQGWNFGEKPITSGDDRAKLAGCWADAALKERGERHG